MDEHHWLWPICGGTWQEKLWLIVIVMELLLLAAGFYCLAWLLAPYC